VAVVTRGEKVLCAVALVEYALLLFALGVICDGIFHLVSP